MSKSTISYTNWASKSKLKLICELIFFTLGTKGLIKSENVCRGDLWQLLLTIRQDGFGDDGNDNDDDDDDDDADDWDADCNDNEDENEHDWDADDDHDDDF